MTEQKRRVELIGEIPKESSSEESSASSEEEEDWDTEAELEWKICEAEEERERADDKVLIAKFKFRLHKCKRKREETGKHYSSLIEMLPIAFRAKSRKRMKGVLEFWDNKERLYKGKLQELEKKSFIHKLVKKAMKDN